MNITQQQRDGLVEAYHLVFDIKDAAPPRDYSDHEHYQPIDESWNTLQALDRLLSSLDIERPRRFDGEGRPVAEATS